MTKHKTEPEQLSLPLPGTPDEASRRAQHNEIVLLLAHLLLSALRREPAAGEHNREPR
jgi:hypothetical protein